MLPRAGLPTPAVFPGQRALILSTKLTRIIPIVRILYRDNNEMH